MKKGILSLIIFTFCIPFYLLAASSDMSTAMNAAITANKMTPVIYPVKTTKNASAFNDDLPPAPDEIEKEFKIYDEKPRTTPVYKAGKVSKKTADNKVKLGAGP